eukprot:g788.t1
MSFQSPFDSTNLDAAFSGTTPDANPVNGSTSSGSTLNAGNSSTISAFNADTSQLLEEDLYDQKAIPKVESLVSKLISTGTYDVDVCTTLLRLYQFYPGQANEQTALQVLALALLSKSSDFSAMLSLLTGSMFGLDQVQKLRAMHGAIEMANFEEFFRLTVTHNDTITKLLPDFLLRARVKVFGIVSLTYSAISEVELIRYLGFHIRKLQIPTSVPQFSIIGGGNPDELGGTDGPTSSTNSTILGAVSSKIELSDAEKNVDYMQYSSELRQLNEEAWLNMTFEKQGENSVVKIPPNGENCTREKEFREKFTFQQMSPLLHVLQQQVMRDAPKTTN